MRTNTNDGQFDAFKQAVWTLAEWLVSEYQRGQLRRDAPPPVATQKPGQKDSSRKLINIEELSTYLSVPKGTLYTDVCLRKIPARAIVKLGRSLRFDKDAIDQWIEESRNEK